MCVRGWCYYYLLVVVKMEALAGLCLLTEGETGDDDNGREDGGINDDGDEPEFGDGLFGHVCVGCGCALAGGKVMQVLQIRLLLRTPGLATAGTCESERAMTLKDDRSTGV
jgi:hypothetical protein